MSHIVTIDVKLTDSAAIRAACQRLKLAAPVDGTHRLYAGPVDGLAVSLPGWRYPVVVDTTTGAVRFDNYGGAWGQQEALNRFLQAYTAEKAKLEARRQGYTTLEQALPDGSLRLTIQTGG